MKLKLEEEWRIWEILTNNINLGLGLEKVNLEKEGQDN